VTRNEVPRDSVVIQIVSLEYSVGHGLVDVPGGVTN
jgi:hypothetical protein